MTASALGASGGGHHEPTMWCYRVPCVCSFDRTAGRSRQRANTGPIRIPGKRHSIGRVARGGGGRRSSRPPGCQALFADFTDEVGQRLSTTLEASGMSPAEAFALLRFFDDREAPQCRAGTTLAFTQTGSRLIRVCGRAFRDRFLQNRRTTEIIVIHEFLHALGLGENPPTSQAITERVAARCSD